MSEKPFIGPNDSGSRADEIRRRIESNQAAIQLLREWREEGDTDEQRETWEFLKKALDDRTRGDDGI